MKKLILFLLILSFSNLYAQKMEYHQAWKSVDSLLKKRLPESTRPLVEKIYTQAKTENNTDQLIKAFAYSMRLVDMKEENASAVILRRFREEIALAKQPAKSVLQSMLAQLFWQYYEQNRWKFGDRTDVAETKDLDIETWSLGKLVEETQKYYLLSIAEKETLQSLELGQFQEILGKENPKDRRLRPTLYDLLAHRAVDWLMNTEPDLASPAYQFVIDKPDYFIDNQAFAKLNIQTLDTTNSKFKALQILQDLIRFHTDNNTDALLDADLKRLRLVKTYSVSSNKEDLYLKALEQITVTYKKSPLVAEAYFGIAEYYHQAGENYDRRTGKNRFEWKKAYEIAENTVKSYPNTLGAEQCANLMALIKHRNLSLTAESYSPAMRPSKALLTYRNLEKLKFRIVPYSFQKWDGQNYYYGEEQEKFLKAHFAEKPLTAWELKLPSNEGDFQAHTAEMKIPELPAGSYLLLATDGEFDLKSTVSWTILQISDLAFVQRSLKSRMEVLVFQRNLGDPIGGAKVDFFIKRYNYNSQKYETNLVDTKLTDNQGKVQSVVLGQNGNNISLVISKGANILRSDRQFYVYGSPTENEEIRYKTFFFTDRAIYRPSQTVYFKAILLLFKPKNDLHEIAPDRTVKVLFFDPNGQKINELELKSNEYGTVSGSFQAPATGLTGEMTLRMSVEKDGFIDGVQGNATFSVEEYKRPKFEVGFDKLEKSYKLGEKVEVKGWGKAFSGANIDNAKVQFRVVRRATFKRWYWWDSQPNSPQMEITNGETVTDEKGTFMIDFEAIPDLKIDPATNPTFIYTVYADITDLNGETHSAQKEVVLAYTALDLGTNLPEKLNLDRLPKNGFELLIKNLEGEFEPTKGNLTITRLKTPDQVFRNRNWTQPDQFLMSKNEYYSLFPFDAYQNEDQMRFWEKDKEVLNEAFDTEKSKKIDISKLKSGAYFVQIRAKDRFGAEVLTEQYVTVFEEKTDRMPYKMADWIVPIKTVGEPSEKAQFLVGTSWANTTLFYEIEHEGEIISHERLKLSENQRLVEIEIAEKHRGNFGVHFFFCRENRMFFHEELVSVPYSNKELEIRFETFRNKLQPAEAEEWKLKISGKKGEKIAAEMVATLYDASLETFRGHGFYFNILDYNHLQRRWTPETFTLVNSSLRNLWNNEYQNPRNREYDYLNMMGLSWYGSYGYMKKTGSVTRALYEESEEESFGAGDDAGGEGMPAMMEIADGSSLSEVVVTALGVQTEEALVGSAMGVKNARTKASPEPAFDEGKKEDFGNVKARSNFNETALFLPHLQTDSEGNVIIKFTIPEALTKWKMLGFAHTKDLKFGFTQNELQTQKDLMVVPNAPRFFRENDKMTFSSKITNLSDKDLNGEAKIEFFDALTNKNIDAVLISKDLKTVLPFTAKAGQSTVVSWNITIPDAQAQAITYRVLAKANNFSDGEEMTLPVLTNRMLVTETMPLSVREGQEKTFVFEKMVNNKSKTLKNHRLSLEMTANPAWYAIEALPYLMEYPHECAEQTFSRFYANSIAAHIANSSPKIKATFETWKNTNSVELVSKLEQNQELKNLILNETPWVAEAKHETERKKRLGTLFDMARMGAELSKALTKLEKMQVSNGGFPWFDGMPESRWVTQHIVAGLGHLDRLGVRTVRPEINASNQINLGVDPSKTWEMITKSVAYLDARTAEDYEELKKRAKENKIDLSKQPASYEAIHYLYARSFFKDLEIPKITQEAYKYYLGQIVKYPFENGLYGEGMNALVLHRNGKTEPAKNLLKSLKERALQNEEMGMYWKQAGGFWWYEAPIETQALMIEAFGEIGQDEKAVNDLKVWLLKQKQTQDWKTTKATVEACYALLLQGKNWLEETTQPEITIGGKKFDPQTEGVKIEEGTGYFKKTWEKVEISPKMGTITIKKPQGSAGVAWGGVYWQYFEQLDKITPAKTPLAIKKQLFLEEKTDKGLQLSPISDKTVLQVGNLVKVRIEIRVDRDMEYVHLKDMRAACFEPINVLSGYRWQDGFGYYESTKDASNNFFISYLRKGIYVFEYPLRVSQAGDFSNGITQIQSMYAPEFTSHSEGIRVRVGER